MKKLGLFLLIMLLITGVVSAQQPGENEPSPAENACNAGGALAGKCDTEWEWTCGWYLALFYEGKAAGVPSTCQILVDVLPEQFRRPGALIYIPPYEPEAGSKGDNACNEGGSMAGKCDTDWEWTCGWYLARYEAAVFAGVPSTCQILVDLIPKPAKDEAVAAGGAGATCSIVYTTATNTIDFSANWGSPLPGQWQVGWNFPCAGGCSSGSRIAPTAASVSISISGFFPPPTGAPGSFRIQDTTFRTILGPFACPVTIR